MFFTTDGPGDLIFLTWTPENKNETLDHALEEGFQQFADCLQSKKAILLHERIYGDSKSLDKALNVRETVFKRAHFTAQVPPTCVEGTPFQGNGIAGLHALALQDGDAGSSPVLELDGKACGRILQGRDAKYLALSDVGRLVRNVGQQQPDEEAGKTFRAVESLLDQAQWSFNEVRRTWFYLHNILDWYDDFNRVRNDAFQRLGLLNGNPLSDIPASTAIQGQNADGGWCTLDVLAMRALDGRSFEAKRLSNPQQNEAVEYGSAFARALSVKTDRCQYIFISGTASIDEHGVSVFEGDFERQTVKTFENLELLLGTAGAKLSDICQATSFVKRPEDVGRYYAVMKKLGLENVPAVCTLADVCRDELLYELDAAVVLPI